ncbi:MAG: hypothetical protein ABFS18_12365 [Thermodesulfobacteriota bacterium]
MKRLSLTVIPLLVVALAFVAKSEARPELRLDENTQSCRNLKDGELEWDSRGYGEGGKVFRELCKSCHSNGNDKGAPFLWAESKTSKAWNRVFTQKYPECAKNGSWKSASAEQLLKVNDYLYRFSQDSTSPFDNC